MRKAAAQGAQLGACEHPGAKARGAAEGPPFVQGRSSKLATRHGKRDSINLYLTKDIGPILHRLYVISLVGATVGIVYGRTGATRAPRLRRRASGSVRSRTYILMREPSLPQQISCLPPY